MDKNENEKSPKKSGKNKENIRSSKEEIENSSTKNNELVTDASPSRYKLGKLKCNQCELTFQNIAEKLKHKEAVHAFENDFLNETNNDNDLNRI